jgi:invasion protein IalB
LPGRPDLRIPDIDADLTGRDGDRTVAVSQIEKRRQACATTRTLAFAPSGARLEGLLLMTYRIASVAAKNSVLSMAAMVALALTVGPHAFAQQPSTKPPARPAQATPRPNAGQAQTVQNGQQQVQLIFSPWTRYCAEGLAEKSSRLRTKKVCFTASDGHLPSGQRLVIALLIEPEGGSDTKLLRVALPLGVELVPGARIVIDEKEAMTAPYVACLPKNGCMADYKADADLIAKLEKGRTLMIQAVNKGQPISFTLPLTDFAKAYDGPPSDPTRLNEQQESLTNELERHSEDRPDAPGGK